jgi:hypothetical protein
MQGCSTQWQQSSPPVILRMHFFAGQGYFWGSETAYGQAASPLLNRYAFFRPQLFTGRRCFPANQHLFSSYS